MIKLYSRETCGPCATLKYWLNKNGISYEELSPEGTTVNIVPTVIIGENVVQGLNIGRIKELLGI